LKSEKKFFEDAIISVAKKGILFYIGHKLIIKKQIS